LVVFFTILRGPSLAISGKERMLMLWKSNWAFIIGIVGVTGYGGTVLATPGSGGAITPLWRATFEEIHDVK